MHPQNAISGETLASGYIANMLNKIKNKTMDLMKVVEEQFKGEKELPAFSSGDTVTVHYKIKEGNKERVQNFRGVVIQRRGEGLSETFTVRKMSSGVGVERIFPVNSPFIEQIDINKKGKVRRARIFYFRKLTGKSARIREKITIKK